MAKLFLSYRRTDAHADVQDVIGRLKRTHGAQSFVDAPPLRAAASAYRSLVENAMRECVGTIVLAGPELHSGPDALGRRRLDDPEDPLRIELEAALKIHKTMIVIGLVGGAELPPVSALPRSLRLLTRRGTIRVAAFESFDADAGYLSSAAGRMLDGSAARTVRRVIIIFALMMAAGVVCALLAAALSGSGGL